MDNRITIHICTRDRHSELGLLLQSLRTQTYQEWDLIILDDASGSPILQCQFLIALLNRIKLENHKIKIIRNDQSFGCCYARNRCIDEDDFDNELCCRLDDDIIMGGDYLERLIKVIVSGYDMASGVIPLLQVPEIKRDTKFVKPIINKKEFDKEGNIIKYGDDCGFCYIQDEIILTPEFRTNCLYKSEINKKIRYPHGLSNVSFREEAYFSFSAILEGYKIGIDTGAICYHLQTPSGGNRCPDYQEKVKLDDESFRKWTKKKFIKHGNFLEEYYKNGIYKNKNTQ